MSCSTSASTHQLLIPDITWNWEDMIIVYHLTFVPLSRAPVAQEFRRLVQVQILAGFQCLFLPRYHLHLQGLFYSGHYLPLVIFHYMQWRLYITMYCSFIMLNARLKTTRIVLMSSHLLTVQTQHHALAVYNNTHARVRILTDFRKDIL